MHRVGLVGLRQAQGFIDLFDSMPDTRVTALCDIDEALLREVGRAHGIDQLYTSVEALVEADIDVVELSTPIQVHGRQAIAAMRAGKHVLCQYVAATDPEEAEELVRVARASGRKYMFIETDCYERKNIVMRELAARGAFGELTFGRGHYIHDCKFMGRDAEGRPTWRGEIWMQGSGGISAAVHSAMPLLQAFGERVVEVYAYGPGARTMPEYRWSDRLTTVGRLASGRFLEFVLDVFSWHPHVFGYCLQGTRGCFEFDRAAFVQDDRLSDWRGLDDLERDFGLKEVVRDSGGHTSAFRGAVQDFLRAIDEDTRPPLDLYDALHITAIGWAADESMATGKPVPVLSFE